MSYDRAYLDALDAAARRERSEQVYCLIARAILWLRSIFTTQPRVGGEACY